MIFRRLSENIKKQNWFSVINDLLIVILGVYLGLQAQQWSQAQQDKQKVTFFVENLSADFASIQLDLERCLQANQAGLTAIAYITELAQQDVDQAFITENRIKIGNSLLMATAGNIPAGRATSFVEMQSSGELQLVKNADLRRALTAYDQMAQSNREAWRAMRNETARYLKPLYSHIDFTAEVGETLRSRINGFDLQSMSAESGFTAMINALKGAKANEYQLCKMQSTQVEKVLSLFPSEAD